MTPPTPVTPRYDKIPEELRKLSNWVVWKEEMRTDSKGVAKPTKVPYNAKTGGHAKSNDPGTWSAFDTAVAAAKGYGGIGFCFSKPFVGLDLDGCVDATGAIEPWAKQILDELASYAEHSPSGKGIHIIAKGKLPKGRRRKDTKGREHHGIEMYDANSARYFTMTGAALNGNAILLRSRRLAAIHARLFPPPPPPPPPPPKPAPVVNGKSSPKGKIGGGVKAATRLLSDDELIDRAKKAKDGGKFAQLWGGDISGYPSQSEADLALCSKLAFWTDRNTARMDTLFRASGLMRLKWDREDYRDRTIAVAIAGTSETYEPKAVPAAAGGSKAKAEAEAVATEGRPFICINAPKLDTVIKESIAALRTAYPDKPRFFVQGLRMVHVARDAQGQMAISEANHLFLRPELERVADFYAEAKDGSRHTARPTLDLARSILARPQVEWKLPELRGVAMGPVLRADGTIVSTPGYDAALRLYYAPKGKLVLGTIPETPTQEDCKKAAEIIGAVFAEFPFVSGADRANYFALLLTPFIRHLVDNVPLALLDSPAKGTGKSLLAIVFALIYEGHDPNLWPPPSSPENWEKVLTTVLLGGHAITIFDNLEHTLHAPVLAKLLTSSEHADRMMRTHTEMRIPNATMFVVTGNNIRVAGDLDRRCYRIRIDAKITRPWERKKFKIPFLKKYVRKHRGELLAALLTIARGWFAAGKPPGKSVEELGGGFEDWSRKVGRMLAYAGVTDFLGNQNTLYDELNPGENSWERFLKTAHRKYPQGFTVAKLVEDVARGARPQDSSGGQKGVHGVLGAIEEQKRIFPKDALPEDRGFESHRGDLDANKIKGAFNRYREKRFGTEGFRLTSEQRKGTGVLWFVKKG